MARRRGNRRDGRSDARSAARRDPGETGREAGRTRAFKALVRLRFLMDRLGRASVPDAEAAERDALLREGMRVLRRIALAEAAHQDQVVADVEHLVRSMTRRAREVAPGFHLSDSVCG